MTRKDLSRYPYLAGAILWAGFFSVFVVLDTTQSWRRAAGHGLTGFQPLQALTRHAAIYYAWVLIALAIGLAVRRWPLNRNGPQWHWGLHLALALLLGGAHLGTVTLLFVWLQPGWVAQQGAAQLFSSLLLEWLHFEVIVYFLAVAFWTYFAAAISEPLQTSNPGIVVRTELGRRIVRLMDIDWFQADDDSVRVHSREEVLSYRRTMKSLQKSLTRHGYFRVHRQALVNLARVAALEGDRVLMRNGERVPVSRRQRAALRKILQDRNGMDRSPQNTDRSP